MGQSRNATPPPPPDRYFPWICRKPALKVALDRVTGKMSICVTKFLTDASVSGATGWGLKRQVHQVYLDGDSDSGLRMCLGAAARAQVPLCAVSCELALQNLVRSCHLCVKKDLWKSLSPGPLSTLLSCKDTGHISE